MRPGSAAFVLLISVLFAACDRASTKDVTVDCSSVIDGLPNRDILRISPDSLTSLHLTLSPPVKGSVKVDEADYTVDFTHVPGFRLRFRINRYTGEGQRRLSDERDGANTTVSWAPVVCKPYEGNPL